MNKRTFVTLCLMSTVFASALVAGCSKQDGTSAPGETANVAAAEREIKIIGLDTQSTPMAFWNSQTGLFSGFDVDLAMEAFKRAGLKYEFKAIDWGEKDNELLRDKSIDVIWSSLTITDARKQLYSLSDPYVENRKTAVVRAGSPITTLADLGGRKVAVQAKSYSVEVVKAYSTPKGPIQVHEVPQRVDMLVALLAGEVDAAVTDSVFLDYYVLNTPGKFHILSESFQHESFGVAFRPEDRELTEKINKALADMRLDGTTQTIYARWFGEAK